MSLNMRYIAANCLEFMKKKCLHGLKFPADDDCYSKIFSHFRFKTKFFACQTIKNKKVNYDAYSIIITFNLNHGAPKHEFNFNKPKYKPCLVKNMCVPKVWVKSMQWKREELNVSHHHYALYMYSLTNEYSYNRSTPIVSLRPSEMVLRVLMELVYIDTHKITRIRHWIKISHLITLWAANYCYGRFGILQLLKSVSKSFILINDF